MKKSRMFHSAWFNKITFLTVENHYSKNDTTHTVKWSFLCKNNYYVMSKLCFRILFAEWRKVKKIIRTRPTSINIVGGKPNTVNIDFIYTIYYKLLILTNWKIYWWCYQTWQMIKVQRNFAASPQSNRILSKPLYC